MLSNETIKWYWNFCRYHIKAPVTFLEVGLFTILTINLKFATRFTKLIHQAQFWKTNIGYILDDLQIAVDFLLPSDVSQIDINCCLNFPTHQNWNLQKEKLLLILFIFLQWLEFKHFSMWHDDLFMVHVFFIIRCTAFDMPLKRTQKKKKKMK